MVKLTSPRIFVMALKQCQLSTWNWRYFIRQHFHVPIRKFGEHRTNFFNAISATSYYVIFGQKWTKVWSVIDHWILKQIASKNVRIKKFTRIWVCQNFSYLTPKMKKIAFLNHKINHVNPKLWKCHWHSRSSTTDCGVGGGGGEHPPSNSATIGRTGKKRKKSWKVNEKW